MAAAGIKLARREGIRDGRIAADESKTEHGKVSDVRSRARREGEETGERI